MGLHSVHHLASSIIFSPWLTCVDVYGIENPAMTCYKVSSSSSSSGSNFAVSSDVSFHVACISILFRMFCLAKQNRKRLREPSIQIATLRIGQVYCEVSRPPGVRD